MDAVDDLTAAVGDLERPHVEDANGARRSPFVIDSAASQ